MAKERHYPLQLSKELNASQQAIMKHLKVLEDNNLVVSYEEKSTIGGPPRKSYISNKHISLRIDVGPHTFNTEVYDFKEIRESESKQVEPKEKDKGKVFNQYEEKFNNTQKISDPNKKLNELSKIVREINNELEDLEMKRSKLLNLRELVVKESNEIIVELCKEYDERKILYYLITHAERNISEISEIVEMREKVIREIVKNFMRQRILFDLEDDIF